MVMSSGCWVNALFAVGTFLAGRAAGGACHKVSAADSSSPSPNTLLRRPLETIQTRYILPKLLFYSTTMSANVLAQRDANQQLGQAADDGKPKSLEYHRQMLESRLKSGQ